MRIPHCTHIQGRTRQSVRINPQYAPSAPTVEGGAISAQHYNDGVQLQNHRQEITPHCYDAARNRQSRSTRSEYTASFTGSSE
ncbi:hypothetical protein FOZ63_010675 [Perkinsus olseni]|uniref:Uncharacterized protein n=1 Tax=Perkinsus olseni TaxID=32597 RepID=A0A7J6RRZ5_PEROL|nr:hypothetical protein FOZ63_010675 [Perkinsus olseni]